MSDFRACLSPGWDVLSIFPTGRDVIRLQIAVDDVGAGGVESFGDLGGVGDHFMERQNGCLLRLRPSRLASEMPSINSMVRK